MQTFAFCAIWTTRIALEMGRDVINVSYKEGKPFITLGAGQHTFKRQTTLRWLGNLFLAGALPLLELYHSATGGGLLADLLSMA